MKKILIKIRKGHIFSNSSNYKIAVDLLNTAFSKLKEPYKIEYADIKSSIDNVSDYFLVVYIFWDLSDRSMKELKLLKSNNVQTLFLSDGLFNYDSKVKSIENYPMLMFSDGPQSAPFCNRNYRTDLPNDRVHLFLPEIELKPWKKTGYKVVVCHQGGVNYNFKDKSKFYKNFIDRLKKNKEYVVFRIHPSFKKYEKKIISSCNAKVCDEIIIPSRIDKHIDTNNVKCCISYGGKVAAQYILRGIPSITIDNTIADPMSYIRINNLNKLKYPDRKPWVNWLSYHHYTLNELSEGFPIKYFIDNNLINI